MADMHLDLGRPTPPQGRTGTVLETDEDIRQALLAAHKGQVGNGPDPSSPVAPQAPTVDIRRRLPPDGPAARSPS